MKTALVIEGRKQRVILQPDDLQESRIIGMLTRNGRTLCAYNTDWTIDHEGGLELKQERFHVEGRPQTIIISVEEATPLPRDPDKVELTKDELKRIMGKLDTLNRDTRVHGPGLGEEKVGEVAAFWFLTELEELRKPMQDPPPEPERPPIRRGGPC